MDSFWKYKKVFVTGGSGLVGSHLVKSLVSKGADVVVLVRDFVPRSIFFSNKWSDKVKIVQGCLTDYHLIERALNEYEIEYVFHLAAQAIVGTSNRSPLSTFESNIRGSYNLLEACRVSKLLKGVVVASSDKAYGSHTNLPYDETFPLQGLHPYDVSKTCTDMLAQTYFNTYQLPVAITRCGNLFGPGDLNFNRIVPDMIRSVILGRRPQIRSNGKFLRDYFYIPDAVDGYLLVAENLHREDVKGNAFNFSSGRTLTVIEITNMILKLMNSSLEPEILDIVKGEIKDQYLSSEKSKSILGWTPKHSVEEGLKETIEWYQKYFQS